MKNLLSTGRNAAAALAAAAAVAALPALARAVAPWFDAGIAGYETWPADGADKVVEGQGAWSGTAGATLDAERHALRVDVPAGGRLAFTPVAPRDAASAAFEQVGFVATNTLETVQPLEKLVPFEEPVKAALAAATDGSTTNFHGWAKDPGGATNVWLALVGATPAAGVATEIRVLFRTVGDELQVQYQVDGTALSSAGGDEWLPVAAQNGVLAHAGMTGGGLEVSSLSAFAEETPPPSPETVVLTLAALPENVSLVSVTTNGVAVAGEGSYTVYSNATVVATFAAAEGYVLTSSAPISVVVDGDKTLTGIPTAVDPSLFLTINEIMASNPDPVKDTNALVTVNGGAEMDWIELYNDADVDVDLAGWYLSDKIGNPTKSPIYGSCVVPAKGYKIVWLDDTYTNWDETEAHADIGLSASGEAVVLAKPDGTILQSIVFPQQIKGYSYGPGTVSYGPHRGEGPCVYMKTATPGAANVVEGWGDITPKVAFGEPHGYKTDSFELVLSCASDPTAAIYYTLDGTSPTTASILYTNAIPVSRTTVVRAAVPDVGSVLQVDASATYLFLDDILAQAQSTTAPATAVGFPDSGAVKSHKMLYGMRQSVVNGSDRDRLLRGFTNSIATISLVIDPANLFDADTGIYVNPAGHGEEWERQTMLEQFDATGVASDFAMPAGLRIRGGNSRKADHPKHALRLFFRSSYGESSLKKSMFPGEDEAAEYDKLDLRCSQNFSWANEGSNAETYIHEVFCRDSQRDMGAFYTRSRYYNLFINGQYWGVYQSQERGDEHFAESYAGGNTLDWDVVKTTTESGKYILEADEGTLDAWSNLWEIATEGFGGAHAGNYARILGCNADGTRNPAYPVLLDPTNLMAYALVTHYVVDGDCPITPQSKHLNNMYCLRDRTDGEKSVHGFFFLRHDGEMSFGKRGNVGVTADPTGWGSGDPATVDSFNKYDAYWNTFEGFSPVKLHWELEKNADYRRACADQFYKHFLRPGGSMTTENNIKRFASRMAELDDAIVCEAARWGAGPNGTASVGSRSAWLNACRTCTNGFLAARMPYMLRQYRARGWYPSVDAPLAVDALGAAHFAGDVVPAGEKVYLAGSGAGTNVYYTVDGGDPVAADGTVATNAVLYDAAAGIVLSGTTTLKARATSAGEWSALEEVPLVGISAEFAPLADALRVAALYTSTTNGGDYREFVVLTNLSAEASINLSGARLVAWNAKKKTESSPSLEISFGAIAIAPGESLVLDQATYFGGGKLTNGQVGLRLYDVGDDLVQDAFVDADWWGGACDNTGAWFVAKEFGASVKERTQWKPSSTSLPTLLRVAAIHSSTTGDGDTGEFVVLTNLNASAGLDLADLRLVAWNAKKKSEAEPSLVIDFTNGLSIAAGGSVTIDQATYFGGGKLVNSKVGLRLYDAAGALAQDVEVNADWWDKACDGTGAFFVALTTNAVAKTDADWAPSPLAPAMPLPEDPDAAAAVLAAVADNPAIGDWLVGIGQTERGYAMITNFTGDADALWQCYLVDSPPEAEPEIELVIPDVSFDASGNVVIGGALFQHDVPQAKTVNGSIRLYYADDLGDLPASSDAIPLGKTFPVEPDSVELPSSDVRFFQLRIE